MNCFMCDMEIKYPARIENATISAHEKCLNNDIIEAVKKTLNGYLYRRNGDLVQGYFHKQHEKL